MRADGSGRPARPWLPPVVALAALALTLVRPVIWSIEPEGRDLRVYAEYARATSRGDLPYRDFPVEYPPGAMAVFAAPGVDGPGDEAYGDRFVLAMALCAAVTLVAVWLTVRRLRAPPSRSWTALAPVALAPALLGPLVVQRYDLVPVALTALALLGAVRGRFAGSGLALGLGTAAKLYPATVLPVLLAAAYRARGLRAAVATAAAFAAGCLLPTALFLVVAPHELLDAIRLQTGRQLHVETPLASAVLFLHLAAGVAVSLVKQANTYAVAGTRGDLGELVTGAALVAALAFVWWRSLRLARSAEGIVLCSAAVLAATVVFARVLSPQFLLWLVAAVPLVRGRAGLAASGLLAAACVLTNAWFPSGYESVVRDPGSPWVVLLTARNVLLLALVALLLDEVRRASGRLGARGEPADEQP